MSKAGAVEKKLVGVADTVITAAEKSKDPTLAIPVRSLANVDFNAKRGIIEMGKRKQARTCSSARSAASATSRSSISGSDSFWPSNVFSCEPFMVCLVR